MSYELLSHTTPKARKAHKCIWCGEIILAGEVHQHQAGKMDGDFQDSRYHNECFTAAARYWLDGVDSSFDPHSFKRGTTEEK